MEGDDELEAVAARLEQGLELKDRRYHLKQYKKCFVGSDAVTFMVDSGLTSSEDDALLLGNVLLEAGYIAHVLREHKFENKHLFYRFTKHEDHGAPAPDASTWSEFLGRVGDAATQENEEALAQKRPSTSSAQASLDLETASQLSPMDEHNLALLSKVHPANWQNPEPKTYDLLVIGAGAGGLVSAAGAAGTGAKVALIEARLLGGDCLNVGCVPSKALLHAASVAAQIRDQDALADLGISVSGSVDINFAKVMERMRRLRAQIADNDSAERFTHKLGVDVFFGHAHFTGKREVEVNGTPLRFFKCVIATGGSPRLPTIDGLSDAYQQQNADDPLILTNESVFNLTELPESIGVIGAGPIGCELAQAFARFGSAVHLFARSGHILAREDEDAAAVVEAALEKDGVTLILDVAEYKHVKCDEGGVHVTVSRRDDPGNTSTYTFSRLLVAAGRRPNVNGLDLDNAKVKFDDMRGVHVNDKLQTSNDRVYAVGDVCSPVQFTHASDFMARMVIRNSLFFGKAKFSNLIIPWCTYTSPEVAHVGASQRALEDAGKAFDVYEKHLDENDRAIVEGDTTGFVRILCKKRTDKIIGATIVAAHAGDLISQITQAMQTNTGLGALAAVIHPYPTQADAIRACGDLFNKTRLTTTVRKVLRSAIKIQRTKRP